MFKINPKDQGYIVGWQSDIEHTKESVFPVSDKPYHTNKGILQKLQVIKNLRKFEFTKYIGIVKQLYLSANVGGFLTCPEQSRLSDDFKFLMQKHKSLGKLIITTNWKLPFKTLWRKCALSDIFNFTEKNVRHGQRTCTIYNVM